MTPTSRHTPASLVDLIDRLLEAPSKPSPTRRRRLLAARTLAKDVRVAARHVVGSWPSRGPASELAPARPAFVWQHHDPFFRLGERLAREADVPLVQFVDAPHVWEGQRWGVRRRGWARPYERLGEVPSLRSADVVACVSEAVADAVRSVADPGCPIAVTPCTPDAAFYEAHSDLSETRRDLGLGPADIAIGWAGSFRAFHAVEDLIRAFEQIAPDLPQTKLVLVGDGADRARLQSIADASSHGNRIRFAGQIPYSRMPEVVASLDITAITARPVEDFHYSPLKLREYRASGRAIVAPAVGQVASTVVHGRDGLLYDAGDVTSLASAISALAVDADLRRRVGEAARQAEEATGGVEAHIGKVLSLANA